MRHNAVRYRILLAACALLLPLLHPTAAQGATSGDVSIVSLELSAEPVVNTTIVVGATVRSTAAGLVDVVFTYSDGQGIRDPSSPAGAGYRITQAFDTPGTRMVNLSFQPGFDRRGAQTISAVASFVSGADANQTNNSKTIPAFVRHAALNVTFTNDTAGVPPLGVAPLRFVVRNDGNAPDRPSATVAELDGNWTVGEISPVGLLAPGEHAVGFLTVEKANGSSSSPLGMVLQVSSSYSTEGKARASAPPLLVDDRLLEISPSLSVSELPIETQVLASESLVVDLFAANDGPTPQVFAIDMDLAPNNGTWNASLGLAQKWPPNISRPILNTTTATIALWPGETAPFGIRVARNGIGAEAASLTLTANATNEAHHAMLFEDIEGKSVRTTLYPAAPRLSLALGTLAERFYEGDVASIPLTVKNGGRHSANATVVEASIRDNLHSIEETTFVIPALAAGAVASLNWSIDLAGISGEIALRADLRAGDDDAGPGPHSANATLDVRDPRLHLILPDNLIAVPGERIAINSATTLGIRNDGSHMEDVVVRLSGDREWMHANWSTRIASNGIQPLPLVIQLPATIGALRTTGGVQAWIVGRDRSIAQGTIELTFRDVDMPVIAFLERPENVMLGQDTKLVTAITDAIAISAVEALVTGPDGHRSRVAANVSPGGIYSFILAGTSPGDHLIEVRAEDTADPIHTATASAHWTVLAPSFAGLLPLGFDEGSLVSTPTLGFREAQLGTVSEAVLDIDGGSQVLDPPYGFELPPIEGPHKLTLRAVSTHGTVTERSWNITLDLTPPRVVDASARSVGEFIEVSATVEGATAVAARFETPRGTIELELHGDGDSFSAKVDPPPAWTSIEIVAVDAAGNHAGRSVETQTSGTPGIGAAWMLALVAIAALLSRRRYGAPP